MGANESNIVPMPEGFNYMCITFRAMDRIRVFYATKQEIDIVRETVKTFCPRGIQEEKIKCGSAYQFKLHGTPFAPRTSAEEAVNTRKLAAQLLFRLFNQGCKLLVSSDLSQSIDLTTWMFHREQVPASQYGFACVGISSTDKLQLVDFPSGMYPILHEVVERNWPQTIQSTRQLGDAYEIKLRGTPWMSAGGFENIQSRTLIKAIINELDMRQWVLYGSSNLKGTADTLIFRYDPTVPTDGSRMAGFVLSLNRNDRLRCIDTPPDAVACVKNMLKHFWPHGIQEEKQKFNAYEFKLAGTPWWADGCMAVDTRFLLCKIFERLWSIGWRVQLAIDLTRKPNDKSVITFQRTAPRQVPIFCLSLNWTDKIRVINAPPNVTQAVVSEIRRLWLFGIAKEGPYGASMEVKLNGSPWSYGFSGHDGTHGRVLLVHLIRLLAGMGWFLILSADVSAKYVRQKNAPDFAMDVHSWWFTQMGHAAPAPNQHFATTPPMTPGPFAPAQFSMEGQATFIVGAGPALPADISQAPPAYSDFQK
eukprot:Seg4.2 transcript_id=Seg4.2/GoldUCD/mRNA.D3Y31 product="hypothetical protein" protein_id=Seg4.2/GoldUCD/D3Y31